MYLAVPVLCSVVTCYLSELESWPYYYFIIFLYNEEAEGKYTFHSRTI